MSGETFGKRPPVHLPRLESAEEVRLRTSLQLVRTFVRMERRIEQQLETAGVTLPQFDVIATLRFGEGISQQELAARLLVTKGNVCGVLDRLERLGWVERRPDAHDRRTNRLHLTPAGRQKVAAVLPAHDRLVLGIFQPLSDAEVKSLRRVLEVLERRVEETAGRGAKSSGPSGVDDENAKP